MNPHTFKHVMLPELGLAPFRDLVTGLDVDHRVPPIHYAHFADAILEIALDNNKPVRDVVGAVVLPHIGEPGLDGSGVARLLREMFGDRARRQNLAMLMREKLLGYRLSIVRAMIVLAYRDNPSEHGKLISLL